MFFLIDDMYNSYAIIMPKKLRVHIYRLIPAPQCKQYILAVGDTILGVSCSTRSVNVLLYPGMVL